MKLNFVKGILFFCECGILAIIFFFFIVDDEFVLLFIKFLIRFVEVLEGIIEFEEKGLMVWFF